MKVGDNKPLFLAIASPPSSFEDNNNNNNKNIFTFLIKETNNNNFITNIQVDDKVDLSIALGKGFQIKEYFTNYKNDFPVNNVLLMACGSGIAPIVAAIERYASDNYYICNTYIYILIYNIVD